MITITLENTDQGDLFVTVTDLNQSPPKVVLTRQRINQRDDYPVDIQEDGHGNGRITWQAQRADDSSKSAQRTVSASVGDTVQVTTFFG
jgi:hypothetical protein